MHKNLITPKQADLDPAARAFEALRDEVTELRSIIDHLSRHIETIPTQDYRKTLAQLLRAQDIISSEIKELKSHPAINLTPERFLNDLEDSKDHFLQKERQSLKDMEHMLLANSKVIGYWIEQARTVNSQNWMIILAGCIGIFIGAATMELILKKIISYI